MTYGPLLKRNQTSTDNLLTITYSTKTNHKISLIDWGWTKFQPFLGSLSTNKQSVLGLGLSNYNPIRINIIVCHAAKQAITDYRQRSSRLHYKDHTSETQSSDQPNAKSRGYASSSLSRALELENSISFELLRLFLHC